MVTPQTDVVTICYALSVLALSSRFDGQSTTKPPPTRCGLSVLALSSRFDGRRAM